MPGDNGAHRVGARHAQGSRACRRTRGCMIVTNRVRAHSRRRDRFAMRVSRVQSLVPDQPRRGFPAASQVLCQIATDGMLGMAAGLGDAWMGHIGPGSVTAMLPRDAWRQRCASRRREALPGFARLPKNPGMHDRHEPRPVRADPPIPRPARADPPIPRPPRSFAASPRAGWPRQPGRPALSGHLVSPEHDHLPSDTRDTDD